MFCKLSHMALLNLNHLTPADGGELNASDLETWYHREAFFYSGSPACFFPFFIRFLITGWFFFFCDLFFSRPSLLISSFRPHPLVAG